MVSAAVDSHALGRLVVDARNGDRLAADRLVREHDRWVRGVIYAVSGRVEIVDDVAQQVWAQVWERLGSLRDPARLRPWLYNVARNAAIDAGMAHRRRRTSAVSIEAAGEPAVDDRQQSALSSIINDETKRRLLEAVQSLPAIYREPFVLRHLEDWSYAQIGEVLGLSVETVETRLVRARRMLRDMLKGKVDG